MSCHFHFFPQNISLLFLKTTQHIEEPSRSHRDPSNGPELVLGLQRPVSVTAVSLTGRRIDLINTVTLFLNRVVFPVRHFPQGVQERAGVCENRGPRLLLLRLLPPNAAPYTPQRHLPEGHPCSAARRPCSPRRPPAATGPRRRLLRGPAELGSHAARLQPLVRSHTAVTSTPP